MPRPIHVAVQPGPYAHIPDAVLRPEELGVDGVDVLAEAGVSLSMLGTVGPDFHLSDLAAR